MTHKDIYEKFMIEYDKANITSSYPSLTQYEIATLLDKAYLALISQKITANNARKAGFESDAKAIEDLRPLLKQQNLTKAVSSTTNPFYCSSNEAVFSAPTGMLYYIQSHVVSTSKEEQKTEKIQNTMLVSHMIADKFRATTTNLPWVSIPVVYLEGNHIHLLYDAVDMLINPQLIATYIKTPKKFALSTTSTPGDSNTGGDNNNPANPDDNDNPNVPDNPGTDNPEVPGEDEPITEITIDYEITEDPQNPFIVQPYSKYGITTEFLSKAAKGEVDMYMTVDGVNHKLVVIDFREVTDEQLEYIYTVIDAIGDAFNGEEIGWYGFFESSINIPMVVFGETKLICTAG